MSVCTARSSYNYRFDGDFQIEGRPLVLSAGTSSAWDAGLVLTRYFAQEYPLARSGQRLSCLELGSGTGITGIGCALLGHTVVLSDVGREVSEAINKHIAMNQQEIQRAGGHATYYEIDWKDLPVRSDFGLFDIVLAADVLYNITNVEPFVQALAWAASGGGAHDFVVAHKLRSPVCDLSCLAAFERLAKEAGLCLVKTLRSDQCLAEDGSSKVFLHHLKKETNM